MKKIISYVKDYFKNQIHYGYFALIIVYTALLVFINFRFDFEVNYIKQDSDGLSRLLKYIGMYSFCFILPYLFQSIFKEMRSNLAKPALWLVLFFSVVVFSIRAWYFQHTDWLYNLVQWPYQTVVYKYAVNLAGFVFLFIPCTVYWLLVDRQQEPLYGFYSKGVPLKPYFGLLLLMVPLLLYAATQADFQEVYPRAEHLSLARDNKGFYSLTALYELCYSADFGVTEFFFRGFLILALSRFVGAKAILPMCVFYVAIHFDKPLFECISSFAGGLILGVLSYKTRSIYGGIIVHLGIALLMEVLGFIF